MLRLLITSGFPIEAMADDKADTSIEPRLAMIRDAVVGMEGHQTIAMLEAIAAIEQDREAQRIAPSIQQEIRIKFFAAILLPEKKQWKQAFDTLSACEAMLRTLVLDRHVRTLALVHIYHHRCVIARNLMQFREVHRCATTLFASITDLNDAQNIPTFRGGDNIKHLFCWALLLRGWAAFNLNRLERAHEDILSGVSLIMDWRDGTTTPTHDYPPAREALLIQSLQTGFTEEEIIAKLRANVAVEVNWTVLYLQASAYFAQILPWKFRLHPGLTAPTQSDWDISGVLLLRVVSIIKGIIAENLGPPGLQLRHPHELVDKLLAIAQAAHSFSEADPSHQPHWLQFSAMAIGEALPIAVAPGATLIIANHYRYWIELAGIEQDFQLKRYHNINLAGELASVQDRIIQLQPQIQRFDLHFLWGYAWYLLGRVKEMMNEIDEACKNYEQAFRMFNRAFYEHHLWTAWCLQLKERNECPHLDGDIL